MEKNKERIIYYKDESSDVVVDFNVNTKKIDGKYKYVKRGIISKASRFFWYRLIATPVAFLFCKLKFHIQIKNKKILKQAKKSGYFLYGNHTQSTADAFIPSLISFPKSAFVIVHADNVSIKFLGKVTPAMGALPLPDDIASAKNFLEAIDKRIHQRCSITIYPEARIWPYYTKIRPFISASFKYPIKYNVPTFCFTNTYQKRKFSNKARITTFIDGPFYPDDGLKGKQREENLRDKVYDCMTKRSFESNFEYVQYIKKEEE